MRLLLTKNPTSFSRWSMSDGIDIRQEINALNGINAIVNDPNGRPVSRESRLAYLRREQEKKDQEQNALTEKNRTKYNNAISGLETEED